jgi:hypothetical protein
VKEWDEAAAQAALTELVKRATTDPRFRALALADPAAAIARINPIPLPTGFKVQVVAADGADMTVVLPDLVANAGELTDAELEQVAGGGDGSRCGTSCAASCEVTA